MKFMVLAGLALTAATPAHGEEWWLASQARTFAGFVDTASISEWGDERTATLWRINYRRGPDGEKSTMLRARFHCRDKVMTVISTKAYDGEGSEIGHFKASYPEQVPERVSRGSIGRAELDFVCENWSRTSRFARKAEVPPQEAVAIAGQLRRLGFTFGDSYALALPDRNSDELKEAFSKLVPPRLQDEVARILGLEPWNEKMESID